MKVQTIQLAHHLRTLLVTTALTSVCVGGVFGLNYYNQYVSYTRSNEVFVDAQEAQESTSDSSGSYTEYKNKVEMTKIDIESKQSENPQSKTIVRSNSLPATAGDSAFVQVPYIKQKYTLSCEFASMEMVLKYFGKTDIDQDMLIAKVGFADPIKPRFEGEKMIWGDPDKGFVGDVNGWFYDRKNGIKGATGWGISTVPVVKVMSEFFPRTYSQKGSLGSLRANLKNGNPVMIWHVTDEAFTQSTVFYTPEGKMYTLRQYHVAVVVGYSVDTNGVVTYTINDPDAGVLTVSEEKLERMWGKHDFDMVVAVK